MRPSPVEPDLLRPAPAPRRDTHRDLLTAGLAAVFFAVVAAVGAAVNGHHVLRVSAPPLYGHVLPHLGPGTIAAPAVAAAVVAYGPGLAARLSWRRLLAASWGASVAWLLALALIDGWHRGVARRLTTRHEYVQPEVIARFDDVHHALRTYTDHILLHSPDHWPAHLAGHPPAAALTFVALDRVGLGGGAWAGVFVIAAAGTAAAGVLTAVRALGEERRARAAAPFLVLAPWAVLAGVSADGYFAAVAAWAVALVAVAARGTVRRPWMAGVGAGVLLGWCGYLSYGLVLVALPVAAVLRYARTVRPLPAMAVGVLAVGAVFTAAGFWWPEGYRLLHERYYEGVARIRPYAYWMWGDLACAVLTAGPAAVAGVRRAFVRRPGGLEVLVLAGLACVVAADLSGMSKGETERIWLPFTLWLLPAAALLPARDRRGWLAVQAGVAMALNHVVLTGW